MLNLQIEREAHLNINYNLISSYGLNVLRQKLCEMQKKFFAMQNPFW